MPTTEFDEFPAEGDQLLNVLVKCGLTTSRGEGRRLIEQGGITINEEKVTNPNMRFTKDQLKEGIKVRKGKKVFQKIILK